MNASLQCLLHFPPVLAVLDMCLQESDFGIRYNANGTPIDSFHSLLAFYQKGLKKEPSAVKIMREDSSRYKWIEIVNGNMQEVHFGNGQQHMHDASKYSI